MGWSRHTGVVVSLALFASVASFFATRAQFQSSRPQAIHRDQMPLGASSPQFDSPFPEGTSTLRSEVADGNATHRLTASSIEAQMLRDLAGSKPPRELKSDTAADALLAGSRQSNREPQRLDGKSRALPTSQIQPAFQETAAEDPKHKEVRRVIEEEMVGTSREERDIWFEELKSLPAGVVRDLLQVRKQLRSLPRALHKSDVPDELATAPRRVADVAAKPISQPRMKSFPDWNETASAIEQATSLTRHNIANSSTAGFKRIRWMLVDAYDTTLIDEPTSSKDEKEVPETTEETKGPQPLTPIPTELNEKSTATPIDATSSGADDQDSNSIASPLASSTLPIETTTSIQWQAIQGDGCRLSTPLLDMKSGILNKTGRQLDLAVEGDGFFVVKFQGKSRFTRCGSLVLDSERRLALAMVDGSALIQPVIVLPEEVDDIQITANGQVLVVQEADSDPTLVGQIQLARFASAERLQPVGATLLAATTGSGPARLENPGRLGRGTIQQGCLEQSNVDVTFELAEIERLQSLIKSLPSTTRPFTASGSETMPR